MQRQPLVIEQDDMEVTGTDLAEMRAMHEIQAGLVMANKFPRDENQAFQNIMNTCERVSLAAKAMYAYDKGGKPVSGATIRLAEAIARNWKHINCGIREVKQENGKSVMRAFAVDLQNNIWKCVEFIVPHTRKANNELRSITDPRDIYEHTANMGARRLRACILALIPADIVEEAVAKCQRVLDCEERKVPLADRIRKMVNRLDKLGVKVEHIEGRLNHKIDLTTAEEVTEMYAIINSLEDNMSRRETWFDIAPANKTPARGMSGFKNALGLSKEPEITSVEIDGEVQFNQGGQEHGAGI
jgi:hypothetical protein